ncbi:putative zinc ribbon protein [Zooshikella ganghwensis]
MKTFIRDDVISKSWILHPRERKYGLELRDYREPINHYSVRNDTHQHHIRSYECVVCNNQWQGSNKCDNCRTHLYSRERLA